MTDSYIGGTTRPHKPPEDEGLNLSFMGIPSASMDTWMHFQSVLRDDLTPCAGRPEWTSGKAGDKAFAIAGCHVCHAKAACAEFAEANGEKGAIWGGVSR